MASVQFGVVKINPTIPSDVLFDATGATLEGSNVLQVTYSDTAFTKAEGKERLINALEQVIMKLKQGATTWPAS
jgi:hypothetical protein